VQYVDRLNMPDAFDGDRSLLKYQLQAADAPDPPNPIMEYFPIVVVALLFLAWARMFRKKKNKNGRILVVGSLEAVPLRRRLLRRRVRGRVIRVPQDASGGDDSQLAPTAVGSESEEW
jgi:hypothetical protein